MAMAIYYTPFKFLFWGFGGKRDDGGWRLEVGGWRRENDLYPVLWMCSE